MGLLLGSIWKREMEYGVSVWDEGWMDEWERRVVSGLGGEIEGVNYHKW